MSVDLNVLTQSYLFLFLGTFGQPKLWDIHQDVSYQHPMVPYDVLVDPQSIPSHPILSENTILTDEVYNEDEKDEESEYSYEVENINETENTTEKEVR